MATNPHIYVSKAHGTNTGASDTSFASAQTGAMTSITNTSVYDNLGSAIAGAAPTDGDTIYLADNHSDTYDNGTTVNINSGGTWWGSGVRIISVDASNVDQYSPGASENLSDSADDFVFYFNVSIHGVTIETGDDVLRPGAQGSSLYIADCTLKPDTTGDTAISTAADGSIVKMVNVDITANLSGAVGLAVSRGGRMEWYGGTLTTATKLFTLTGDDGGSNVLIVGVDLSSITTIINTVVNSQDSNLIKLVHCKLNSGVTLPGTATLKSANHRFEMYNCDDTAGDFHRFYIADGVGVAQNVDSTYVTATESWYEGSDKSSIQVETAANCSHNQPFVFELPAQYVDLGDTAKDTLTIDLTTDQTLTDTDIAAFLVYPDRTTQVQPNWVTSGKTVGAGNYGIDPLAAGTTLTASALGAGDWTGEPVSPNFYEMVLDTSGDPGEATAVAIRIEVYKASIAAGELFIHPLITVSAT